MKMIVGVRSDVGRVREGNEDSYLVREPLFVVADGMGGHTAGDVASQTAIETIQSADSGSLSDEGSLERVIKEANSAIWSRSQAEPSLRGMGTTCTLILVDGTELHIGHVGDSRAYLLRNGELSQLTEDHTLVGRMVKEGRLSPEEADHHPQRSIITRALGVDPEVQVDLSTVGVEQGDRVLICSDGLTSMLEADAIGAVLEEETDPQRAVDRLVDLANEAGGEDNITVVVVAFTDAEGAPETARATAAMTKAEGDGARAAPAPGGVAVAQPGAEDTGFVRVDTDPARRPPRDEPRPPRHAEPAARRARGGAWRAVIGTLLIVAILLVGGFAVFRYVIVPNSYFVGINDEGTVVIYEGLADEVAGFTFQEEAESSSIALADLPTFLRADVREGIEADSLDDARRTVENLEQRARDEEFDRQQERKRNAGKDENA
jgi:protein phosphatase